MAIKSMRSLKVSIGKALTKSNIRKASYTSTKQRVNTLASSGYEFKNDCLTWSDRNNNDKNIIDGLYKMEKIIQESGLGYHISLDESEKCIWLCEDSGE